MKVFIQSLINMLYMVCCSIFWEILIWTFSRHISNS